ncbi:MAG TPA: hypothetical protein VK968_09535, partial [Roseimicrobium sp.]|nr:hypothetical protein [Roseimicrobium sp.]
FPKFFTRTPKELKPGAVAVFTGYAPKHISSPSYSNRWSIRFQWQDSVETDSSHYIESAKVDF